MPVSETASKSHASFNGAYLSEVDVAEQSTVRRTPPDSGQMEQKNKSDLDLAGGEISLYHGSRHDWERSCATMGFFLLAIGRPAGPQPEFPRLMKRPEDTLPDDSVSAISSTDCWAQRSAFLILPDGDSFKLEFGDCEE
jgi:hypothetical protein